MVLPQPEGPRIAAHIGIMGLLILSLIHIYTLFAKFENALLLHTNRNLGRILSAMEDCITVSYTHLDVYKRQYMTVSCQKSNVISSWFMLAPPVLFFHFLNSIMLM